MLIFYDKTKIYGYLKTGKDRRLHIEKGPWIDDQLNLDRLNSPATHSLSLTRVGVKQGKFDYYFDLKLKKYLTDITQYVAYEGKYENGHYHLF